MSKTATQLICLMVLICYISCNKPNTLALKAEQNINLTQLEALISLQGAIAGVSSNGTVMLIDTNTLVPYSTTYTQEGEVLPFKYATASANSFFMATSKEVYKTAHNSIEKANISLQENQSIVAIKYIGNQKVIILLKNTLSENKFSFFISTDDGKSYQQPTHITTKQLLSNLYTINDVVNGSNINFLVQEENQKYNIITTQSPEKLAQTVHFLTENIQKTHYITDEFMSINPINTQKCIYTTLNLPKLNESFNLPNCNTVKAIKSFQINNNTYTFLLNKEGIYYQQQANKPWQLLYATQNTNMFIINNNYLFLQKENQIEILTIRVL